MSSSSRLTSTSRPTFSSFSSSFVQWRGRSAHTDANREQERGGPVSEAASERGNKVWKKKRHKRHKIINDSTLNFSKATFFCSLSLSRFSFLSSRASPSRALFLARPPFPKAQNPLPIKLLRRAVPPAPPVCLLERRERSRPPPRPPPRRPLRERSTSSSRGRSPRRGGQRAGEGAA